MSETPRISKRFQIEEIKNRVIEETVIEKIKDEETGTYTIQKRTQERKVPVSYMVYFPQGHSIWCETKADLARLRLTESENFEIDLETGLPVAPPKHVDLKSRVERATRSR